MSTHFPGNCATTVGNAPGLLDSMWLFLVLTYSVDKGSKRELSELKEKAEVLLVSNCARSPKSIEHI